MCKGCGYAVALFVARGIFDQELGSGGSGMRLCCGNSRLGLIRAGRMGSSTRFRGRAYVRGGNWVEAGERVERDGFVYADMVGQIRNPATVRVLLERPP